MWNPAVSHGVVVQISLWLPEWRLPMWIKIEGGEHFFFLTKIWRKIVDNIFTGMRKLCGNVESCIFLSIIWLITGFSSKLVFNLAEHPTVPGRDLNPGPLSRSLEEGAILTELTRPNILPYLCNWNSKSMNLHGHCKLLINIWYLKHRNELWCHKMIHSSLDCVQDSCYVRFMISISIYCEYW